MSQVECENHVSCFSSKSVKHSTEKAILNEIECGNYIVTGFKPKIISALGAVPKPKSEEIRLIHDGSRPFGNSMNSYATYEKCRYTSIDEVCANIKPGSYCAKVDLSSAYRSVPISKDDYCATGLKWKFSGCDSFTYMYDSKLCFGSSKAPGIFQRITESVCRMLKRRGHKCVLVYLDDFIIIADTYKECVDAFKCLLDLLQNLGFCINWKKVVPPTQNIVFLGVLIDTLAGTLSIPDEKLDELKHELKLWLNRKWATKHQLQQVIGKLNWAAKLLRATRPFLRRLIDLMCTLEKPHYRVRLISSVKEDLRWLQNACVMFNGTVAIVKNQPLPEPCCTLYSDASSSGGASFCDGDWFYANWDLDFPEYSDLHINMKELFTVVLAFRRWGHLWPNRHVTIFTDNKCTMFSLNKGSLRNSIGMGFIREIYHQLATDNITISAKFIGTKENTLADALSRLDTDNCALLAAELLLPHNELILHDSYPMCCHMSENSCNFISQALYSLKWDIWTEMYSHTGEPCLLNPPRQLTRHI